MSTRDLPCLGLSGAASRVDHHMERPPLSRLSKLVWPQCHFADLQASTRQCWLQRGHPLQTAHAKDRFHRCAENQTGSVMA